MTFTPAVGTEGRVRTGSNVNIDGVMEWRITKTLAVIPINHFELGADSDGIVWQAYGKGLATATATLRGHYNMDGTLKTEGGTPGIKVGATVTLDLYFTRTPFGYADLAAICTQFEAGTNIENQTATYSANFQITGAAAVAA